MRVSASTISLPLVAAMAAALAAGGAAGAEMASHRAIYTLELGRAGYAANVAELSGQLALDVAETCDGWTYEERTVRRIVGVDGAETRIVTSFSSWESKDGTRFRFVQRTRRDGETVEEFSGRAEMTDAGGGIAYFTKPEGVEIRLPPGTLFPFRHNARLIARAEAGDRQFVAVLFDGSGLDNPNRVSAFIGRRTQVPGLVAGAGPQTAWPVRFAFFSLDRGAVEPDVEIGVLLQADGVARELDIDYGAFAVHGQIERFEPVSPVPC